MVQVHMSELNMVNSVQRGFSTLLRYASNEIGKVEILILLILILSVKSDFY
uniref:Uncharacterized protein n=1 Tax=virus sp. ctLTC15 TaxID=2826801 RepID=A0A8S5R7S6_9VIRU|nr:MAG TPA: hypothetical protein [virus sp. ctLTC15]